MLRLAVAGTVAWRVVFGELYLGGWRSVFRSRVRSMLRLAVTVTVAWRVVFGELYLGGCRGVFSSRVRSVLRLAVGRTVAWCVVYGKMQLSGCSRHARGMIDRDARGRHGYVAGYCRTGAGVDRFMIEREVTLHQQCCVTVRMIDG